MIGPRPLAVDSIPELEAQILEIFVIVLPPTGFAIPGGADVILDADRVQRRFPVVGPGHPFPAGFIMEPFLGSQVQIVEGLVSRREHLTEGRHDKGLGHADIGRIVFVELVQVLAGSAEIAIVVPVESICRPRFAGAHDTGILVVEF